MTPVLVRVPVRVLVRVARRYPVAASLRRLAPLLKSLRPGEARLDLLHRRVRVRITRRYTVAASNRRLAPLLKSLQSGEARLDLLRKRLQLGGWR